MKKLIIAICLIVLSSCNDAMDHDKCLQNVQDAFPNSKIYKGESNFRFIVIDSQAVRYVETMNLSDTRISDVKTFKILPQRNKAMNEEIKAKELIEKNEALIYQKLTNTGDGIDVMSLAKAAATSEAQGIIDELELILNGTFEMNFSLVEYLKSRITFYKGVITAIESK